MTRAYTVLTFLKCSASRLAFPNEGWVPRQDKRKPVHDPPPASRENPSAEPPTGRLLATFSQPKFLIVDGTRWDARGLAGTRARVDRCGGAKILSLPPWPVWRISRLRTLPAHVAGDVVVTDCLSQSPQAGGPAPRRDGYADDDDHADQEQRRRTTPEERQHHGKPPDGKPHDTRGSLTQAAR
jgi:hypothetical protein